MAMYITVSVYRQSRRALENDEEKRDTLCQWILLFLLSLALVASFL